MPTIYSEYLFLLTPYADENHNFSFLPSFYVRELLNSVNPLAMDYYGAAIWARGRTGKAESTKLNIRAATFT